MFARGSCLALLFDVPRGAPHRSGRAGGIRRDRGPTTAAGRRRSRPVRRCARVGTAAGVHPGRRGQRARPGVGRRPPGDPAGEHREADDGPHRRRAPPTERAHHREPARRVRTGEQDQHGRRPEVDARRHAGLPDDGLGERRRVHARGEHIRLARGVRANRDRDREALRSARQHLCRSGRPRRWQRVPGWSAHERVRHRDLCSERARGPRTRVVRGAAPEDVRRPGGEPALPDQPQQDAPRQRSDVPRHDRYEDRLHRSGRPHVRRDRDAQRSHPDRGDHEHLGHLRLGGALPRRGFRDAGQREGHRREASPRARRPVRAPSRRPAELRRAHQTAGLERHPVGRCRHHDVDHTR